MMTDKTDNRFKLFEGRPNLEWCWQWKSPFFVKLEVIQVYVLLAETGQCCHIFKMRKVK